VYPFANCNILHNALQGQLPSGSPPTASSSSTSTSSKKSAKKAAKSAKKQPKQLRQPSRDKLERAAEVLQEWQERAADWARMVFHFATHYGTLRSSLLNGWLLLEWLQVSVHELVLYAVSSCVFSGH
jgi:hypothetical protein